jgi:uncharacterized phiE125 gp8 family phage protein
VSLLEPSMPTLRRTAAPDELPVSVDDVRFDLRLIDTSQDAAIESYIAAAVEELDGKDGSLGRALVNQSWELILDAFPCASEIKIPLPPLQEVTGITYIDTNGDEQTLATSVYAVDSASEPGVVSLKYGQVWPATRCQRGAVTIAFTCGYGVCGDVPQSIRDAIKLKVADRLDQQSNNAAAIDRLLFRYRVFS